MSSIWGYWGLLRATEGYWGLLRATVAKLYNSKLIHIKTPISKETSLLSSRFLQIFSQRKESNSISKSWSYFPLAIVPLNSSIAAGKRKSAEAYCRWNSTARSTDFPRSSWCTELEHSNSWKGALLQKYSIWTHFCKKEISKLFLIHIKVLLLTLMKVVMILPS